MSNTISRWWYGIALEAAYAAISLLVWAAAQFYLNAITYLVTAVVTGFGTLLLAIVFPISIYRDTTAIREASRNWEPKPWRYALLALVAHLSILIIPPYSVAYLLIPLAVSSGYLYQRHRKIGVP